MEERADMGIALDGDADRLIVCDENGRILDGDQIMALCALELMEKGALPGNMLVSTVMSNMALELFMKDNGGTLLRTGVGDRYVVEAMRRKGAMLGGEQSGHLIFMQHSTTGDGLLAALQLLRIMREKERPLSELAGLLEPFPQVLKNVHVKRKIPFDQAPEVQAAVRKVENALRGKGRVLLRYSGTEAVCRVMVEGPDADKVDMYTDEIVMACEKYSEIVAFLKWREPMDIKKVVIPVAGWGTRSLPATKNVPKEMLPIFRKPIVQYIVEEGIDAGLTDVVFVTNQNKTIIEDHFDRNFLLEQLLERAGKTKLLEEVRRVANLVNVIGVRQKEQLGLGHAVLTAREICKNEAFAVMLGDDLMFGKNTGIGELIKAAQATGKAVVGVIEVPEEKVSKYGVIGGERLGNHMYRVTKLVEKPSAEAAPSNLAIIGRYVLLPEIFDILEGQKAGVGGEIQLTDALQGLADQDKLIAVKLGGQRFDAGDWVEYLTANIYFALHDEELHDDLVRRLQELLPCSE